MWSLLNNEGCFQELNRIVRQATGHAGQVHVLSRYNKRRCVPRQNERQLLQGKEKAQYFTLIQRLCFIRKIRYWKRPSHW